MQTIKERVRAGAEFLDFIYGKAWHKRVDLETLDVARGRYCILGQTDSNFLQHAYDLHLDKDDSVQFGFLPSCDWLDDPTQFSRLTKAWKQYLGGHN